MFGQYIVLINSVVGLPSSDVNGITKFSVLVAMPNHKGGGGGGAACVMQLPKKNCNSKYSLI